MSTARANLKTEVSADTTSFSAAMRKTATVAQATGAKVSQSFTRAATGMGNMAISATKAAGKMALIGVALGAAGIVAGIKRVADLGGTLVDLSARTGVAAGDLMIMSRAFEDAGISADKIGPKINKLQKGIYDFGKGSATARKGFDALGISFEDISKLDPGAQFALIQKRISSIQDPTQRAAVAMQIFGRSGGELLAVFANGGALDDASTALGSQSAILTRRAADFDKISDILGRTGAKLQGFFVGVLDRIADDLIPILEQLERMDFAKMGQDAGDLFKEWAPHIWAALQVIAKIVKLIMVAFSPTVWESLNEGLTQALIGPLRTFIEAWDLFMSGHPLDALKRLGNVDVSFDTSKFDKGLAKIEGVIKDVTAPLAPIGTSSGDKKGNGDFRDKFSDKFGEDGPKFDDFGPTKHELGAGKKAGDRRFMMNQSIDAGKAGFQGLSGLYEMQAEKSMGKKMGTMSPSRLGNDMSKRIGEGGMLAGDRARLGITTGFKKIGGLGGPDSTGGLGAKRQVGRTREEREASKKEGAAKTIQQDVSDIATTLKQAISVD